MGFIKTSDRPNKIINFDKIYEKNELNLARILIVVNPIKYDQKSRYWK